MMNVVEVTDDANITDPTFTKTSEDADLRLQRKPSPATQKEKYDICRYQTRNPIKEDNNNNATDFEKGEGTDKRTAT